MAMHVFRWELPSGDDPLTGCFVNNGKEGNYQYVFTTMVSALMWLEDLAWGYDNPTHSDLVLCIYEADECYPVCVDIGTRDNPHPSFSNGISHYCNEFIARIWNRVPISYMKYEDIKAYGKLLQKASRSKKALAEFLQLSSKQDLDKDLVVFTDEWKGTCWYHWEQEDSYEVVTKNN